MKKMPCLLRRKYLKLQNDNVNLYSIKYTYKDQIVRLGCFTAFS